MKHAQLILLAVLSLCPVASASERARAVLVEHKSEILEASRSFGIAPRLLASIVYAEQSLNVKPGEDVLDVVLAMSGYNASVGVAQVKVQTARWIRLQLESNKSVFYDRARIESLGTEDIPNELSTPKTNLLYAAAYVKMIRKVWEPILKEVAYETRVAGIVASIYSLGLLRSDGTLRLPHEHAAMNRFGEAAQSFFDSFELSNEFPG